MNINVVNIGEEKNTAIDDADFIANIINLLESDTKEALFMGKPWIKYKEDKMNEAIAQAFEKIHCNPKHPENHNIYASQKNVYAPFNVHQNGEWQPTSDFTPIKEVAFNTKNKLTETIGLYSDCYEEKDEDKKVLDRGMFELNRNYESVDDIRPKLCHKILNTAYKNKEVIKPNFQKTKKRQKLNLNIKRNN